jgi:hypothetical protein
VFHLMAERKEKERKRERDCLLLYHLGPPLINLLWTCPHRPPKLYSTNLLGLSQSIPDVFHLIFLPFCPLFVVICMEHIFSFST